MNDKSKPTLFAGIRVKQPGTIGLGGFSTSTILKGLTGKLTGGFKLGEFPVIAAQHRPPSGDSVLRNLMLLHNLSHITRDQLTERLKQYAETQPQYDYEMLISDEAIQKFLDRPLSAEAPEKDVE